MNKEECKTCKFRVSCLENNFPVEAEELNRERKKSGPDRKFEVITCTDLAMYLAYLTAK